MADLTTLLRFIGPKSYLAYLRIGYSTTCHIRPYDMTYRYPDVYLSEIRVQDSLPKGRKNGAVEAGTIFGCFV